MKYLNIITALTVSGLLVSGCSKPSPEELLAEAKLQLSQGQDKQAIITLKNAIVEDSRQLEARLLLAKIYLSNGDGLSAVKELKRSSSLGAKEPIIAGLMVEALFMAQEFQSLIDYVDELMPATREAQQSEFLFYQAFSYLELGKLEAAKRLIQRAPALPDSEYSLATEYIFALVNDEKETLEKLGERIISVDSVFADALWLVGKVSYIQADYAMSVQALSRFEQQRPQFLPAAFLLAKALMQSGNVEGAGQKVDVLLAANPDEPVTNLLAATLAFQTKKYDKAFEYATKTIQISGNNAQSQLIAGLSAYFTGDIESAFYYLDPIESLLSEGHVAKRVYLATLVKLQKTDKAFKFLSSEDMQDEHTSVLLDRTGLQLIVSGDANRGQQLLEKSRSLNELASDGYYQGIAKLLTGDEDGLQILKNLVTANPNDLFAKLSIASVLISEGQFEEAEQYLAAVENAEFATDQTTQVAWQLNAKIARATGTPDQVATAYKNMLTRFPANVEANLFFAFEALKSNDGQAAMPFVEKILSDNPANQQAVLFGVVALQQMGETDKVLPFLQKARTSQPDNETLQLMYAETLYRQGNAASAMTALDAMYANLKTLSKRYWQLNAEVTKQVKSIDAYLDALRQWGEAYPDDIAPLYRLAEFFLAARDFDKAKTLIDKALNMAPEDTAIQLQYADWQIETRQLNEARLTLAGMEVTDIFATAKLGLEGKLDYFAGRYDAALPKVAQFYADKPTIQYATLMRALLFKLNRKEDARSLLSKHLSENPDHNVIRILLANDLYEIDPQAAIDLFEASLTYSADNEVVLYSLASLALEHGQYDKATNYAAQLLALNKDNSKYLNLSGKALLNTDEDRLAVKRLKQAFELSKENVIYAMDYAEGLLKTGDKQAAIEVINGIGKPLPAFRNRLDSLIAQSQD
ncbi:XrtA/PEP-CTERM system TPR-repeat protein PrsT [Alteromonas sp. AMM-1]|uniref:XrtA/PEP-CTERM system TPR-repeat protein PrsT n=1 Tax=Alteromonas sp. AMM-1 TaxID=3394233 RepID=UPI0039A6D3A9